MEPWWKYTDQIELKIFQRKYSQDPGNKEWIEESIIKHIRKTFTYLLGQHSFHIRHIKTVVVIKLTSKRKYINFINNADDC